MNISSVVIYLGAGADEAALRAALQDIDGCELVAYEGGKAVATISAESFESEITAFRAIEALSGVEKVMMIYSYCELDDDIAAASSNSSEQIMRKLDETDANEIKYGGKVRV